MASLSWRLLQPAKTRSSNRSGASARLDLTFTGSRSGVEAKDYDLRSPDFGRHGGRYVAGRHRDFLGAVHCISDHPAADRAADLLAPQLLASLRIQRIE